MNRLCYCRARRVNPEHVNRVINGVPFCFSQCVRERRNTIILRWILGLASVAISLLVLAAINSVFAESFSMGEETGFSGVYCPSKADAEALAASLNTGVIPDTPCTLGAGYIKILRFVGSKGRWNIYKVDGGKPYYIVTVIQAGEGI